MMLKNTMLKKETCMMIRIRLFIATFFYAMCIVWHTLDVLCERIANWICGVDQGTIDIIKGRSKL